MMKISDIQTKDIINIETGKRIGHLSDLDINLETGQIDAIVVNASGKMMSFFNKEPEVVIEWNQIYKIGDDVILVQLSDSV